MNSIDSCRDVKFQLCKIESRYFTYSSLNGEIMNLRLRHPKKSLNLYGVCLVWCHPF